MLRATPKTIAAELNKLQALATDPEICADNCKSMYFCALKKGHKGRHSDGQGLSWEQKRQ